MGPRGSKVSDPLFPYTPLFRSLASGAVGAVAGDADAVHHPGLGVVVAAGVVLGGPVVPERHRAGCPREAALVLRAVHLLVEAEQERSEEHTSELQSLMRNSYAVFCLNNKRYKQHCKTRLP